MRRLREYRRDGDPRVLIRVYAAFTLGEIAWVGFVPGGLHYAESGVGSFGQAVMITLPVLYFLSRGSLIAWWAAIFFAVGGAAIGVAGGLFADPNVFGLAVLDGAALLAVWSPSVERFVLGERAAGTPSRALRAR